MGMSYSPPLHPQAAMWWLRIVAADPRYLSCLTVDDCSSLLSMHVGDAAACIDRDGDCYALGSSAFDTFAKYDPQVVLCNGIVQPCTDTLVAYLDKRHNRWRHT